MPSARAVVLSVSLGRGLKKCVLDVDIFLRGLILCPRPSTRAGDRTLTTRAVFLLMTRANILLMTRVIILIFNKDRLIVLKRNIVILQKFY